MRTYCMDERHGVPCPLPCPPCQDDCDPTQQVTVEGSSVDAMRAWGWSEEYIATFHRAEAKLLTKTLDKAP
jgi:hypothetical protein